MERETWLMSLSLFTQVTLASTSLGLGLVLDDMDDSNQDFALEVLV